MAFFRPFLNDPFFSTPSASLFSPSSSLLFDDDPFFSTAPLYVYDAPTSRRRAGRMNAGNGRQQQLKEQQAGSQDNAQVMVSGGDNASAPAASTISSSSSPANKQTSVANNTSSNHNINSRNNNAVSNLRQPRLLSPLSMLSAFNPNTSLLSSRAVLPSMSVDLLSTDKEYTVHASVPGVAKNDLKVMVEDGVLTIEAERREETKQSSSASPKNNNNGQQVQQPSPTNNTTTSSGQPREEKQREEKAEQGQAAIDTGSSNTTTSNNSTTSNNNSSSTQPMETEQDIEPQYHHVESFYGHISRSITLPDDCNTAAMAAKYEDGVLKISIPRLQEKRQRGTRLEIQ